MTQRSPARSIPSLSLFVGCVAWMALAATRDSAAREWRVEADGSGDTARIQEAIDQAISGDVIILAPGRYVETLQFRGADITVRSQDPDDPDVVDATVIDADNQGSVARFDGRETAACLLTGVTLTGGRAAQGGGIHGQGTRATIRANRITSNTAEGRTGDDPRGGGLFQCAGRIEGNRIESNRAWTTSTLTTSGRGGGLAECGGEIWSNFIQSNTASGPGGGLFACDAWVEGNHIAGNQSLAAGGGAAAGDGHWRNNLFVGNRAEAGGALSGQRGVFLHNTLVSNHAQTRCGGMLDSQILVFKNCIFWNNDGPETQSAQDDQILQSTAPLYSCVQGWTGGNFNIAADPAFVDPLRDFHLRPDSPAIDAGGSIHGVVRDLDGRLRPIDSVREPRGDGSNLDMGAYEYPIPLHGGVTVWRLY